MIHTRYVATNVAIQISFACFGAINHTLHVLQQHGSVVTAVQTHHPLFCFLFFLDVVDISVIGYLGSWHSLMGAGS